MAALAQRWRLAGAIFLAVLFTAGCNPLMAPFFLGGSDPKYDPDFKLAAGKKEVRVLVLTYCSSLETRPELLGADRELTSLVAQKLVEGAKENKEKLTVVAGSAVQRYTDEHPNWQTMAPEEIGEHFRSDYVIEMEIDKLTLYEPLSNKELYRGQAELSVKVHDVRKPGTDPVFHKEYSVEYPRSRPVPITDTNPRKFRLDFLTRVATDISWYFTARTVADNFPCD